jgi:hypothetical protein
VPKDASHVAVVLHSAAQPDQPLLVSPLESSIMLLANLFSPSSKPRPFPKEIMKIADLKQLLVTAFMQSAARHISAQHVAALGSAAAHRHVPPRAPKRTHDLGTHIQLSCGSK